MVMENEMFLMLFKLLILALGIWIGFDIHEWVISKIVKTDSVCLALWASLKQRMEMINSGKFPPMPPKKHLIVSVKPLEKETDPDVLHEIANNPNASFLKISQDDEPIIKEESSEPNEPNEPLFDKEIFDLMILKIPCLKNWLLGKTSLKNVISKAYDEGMVDDNSLTMMVDTLLLIKEDKECSQYIIENTKRKRRCKSQKTL